MGLQKPPPNPLPVAEQSPLVLTTLNVMATALAAAIVDEMVNVNLASRLAGEDITRDLIKVVSLAKYTRITASRQIKGTAGLYIGFKVLSVTDAPTMDIYDSTTASGLIVDSYTLTAGMTASIPAGFAVPMLNGIYAKITGTATVMFFSDWED
jgi:hypothetical protein